MDTEEPVKMQPPPRRFVEVLPGGGLFASIVSAIYPVLRFLVPPPVVDLGGDEIVAGNVGDLKPNGSKIVRFGTRPALLLMTAEGEYRALSSNHGTVHPTDAKLDAGPEAVCMQGHKPGDICDQQRAAMRSGLQKLDDAVEAAEKVLVAAESPGLEVSQARLDQDQARDALTKVRGTRLSPQRARFLLSFSFCLRCSDSFLPSANRESGGQCLKRQSRSKRGSETSVL